MEKTLEIHLEEQVTEFSRLLSKHAVQVSKDDWYVPAQVALDIVCGRIKE
jgi:hypothetical protein